MESFIDKVLDKCRVEDLMNGYVYNESYRVYTCIFCGEVFEADLIYKHEEQFFTAKKAIETHILEKHESPFDFLLNMDRKHTNLTDRQREIFQFFYNESDNKLIAEQMETTPSTVRSYKFKMREKLRQSKIYIALMYLVEQQNDEDINLNNDNISDIALYEKAKNIQENNHDIKNDSEVEELINENYKGGDLNLMNSFIDKKGPGMEK